MYEEDVSGRLLQIASVLEGLQLIEKKVFRVHNFEYTTYSYKGPNVSQQINEQEFSLNRKRYNLKKLRIPLEKVRVDSVLFIPFLHRQSKVNHRVRPV